MFPSLEEPKPVAVPRLKPKKKPSPVKTVKKVKKKTKKKLKKKPLKKTTKKTVPSDATKVSTSVVRTVPLELIPATYLAPCQRLATLRAKQQAKREAAARTKSDNTMADLEAQFSRTELQQRRLQVANPCTLAACARLHIHYVTLP